MSVGIPTYISRDTTSAKLLPHQFIASSFVEVNEPCCFIQKIRIAILTFHNPWVIGPFPPPISDIPVPKVLWLDVVEQQQGIGNDYMSRISVPVPGISVPSPDVFH